MSWILKNEYVSVELIGKKDLISKWLVRHPWIVSNDLHSLLGKLLGTLGFARKTTFFFATLISILPPPSQWSGCPARHASPTAPGRGPAMSL